MQNLEAQRIEGENIEQRIKSFISTLSKEDERILLEYASIPDLRGSGEIKKELIAKYGERISWLDNEIHTLVVATDRNWPSLRSVFLKILRAAGLDTKSVEDGYLKRLIPNELSSLSDTQGR